MTKGTRRGGRGLLAAVAGSLIVTGAMTCGFALYEHAGPPQPPPSPDGALAGSWPGPEADPSGPAVPELPRSTPTRIEIPSIRVRAKVTALGLQPDGTLEVPPLSRVREAGWYRLGPAPGQSGPAVLSGHVDSRTGPGVFYRLGAVKPGARVVITRQDRRAATFRVTRIERVDKDRFPTSRVYGPVGHAGLRLITCGGSFDRAAGHYRDNIIVYGVRVG